MYWETYKKCQQTKPRGISGYFLRKTVLKFSDKLVKELLMQLLSEELPKEFPDGILKEFQEKTPGSMSMERQK